MRTPAGVDCAHYYQDFHRGRSQQECRLIDANPDSKPWKVSDCSHCTVPAILRANGNPNLKLEAQVKNGGFLWLKRYVHVSAKCTKHNVMIKDPYVGCSKCIEELIKKK